MSVPVDNLINNEAQRAQARADCETRDAAEAQEKQARIQKEVSQDASIASLNTTNLDLEARLSAAEAAIIDLQNRLRAAEAAILALQKAAATKP